MRPPAQPISPIALVFMLSCGIALAVLFMQISDIGEQAANLVTPYTHLTQARGLDPHAWAAILLACNGDVKCSPWLAKFLRDGMAWYWLVLLLPVIATPIAIKLFPKKKQIAMKDPGMAHWETKDKLERLLKGNDTEEDPFVAFMGYLKPGKDGGDFDATDLPPLFIPLEDWCQNTLVWGGIRSGKTTAFFQPNIFLAAHLGLTCVVFDVKWPQKDSGFFETIGYWHARGRRVVLLSPFELYGARVNLLSDVNSFSDALEKANEIFPPPEFVVERGQFHNEKRRFGIAAFMWILRTEKGDRATMRDVLDYAMMPEDRLMTWVENSKDEEAKSIIMGYKDAGPSAFAETRNGIISALKIFFNADLVRATSGLAHETVNLEDCIRESTLVIIGINQKNNVDGSAEVLFRLYKRLLDTAAMRVAEEQGGKLRRHLAYFLDEKANIGRLNYMIRSLSMLRSFNMSHHMGIQNQAQNELVDGELYWKAMSTSVVARVIVFPRGINGDDAKKVSEIIGKTTATEVSVSGSRGISPFLVEGSNSASASLKERFLLSFEEFSDFSLGEAVIRMNGQQPIRTQLVPMGMKFIQGTGIRKGKRRNVMYELYKETLSRCPGGLIAYTNMLIKEGKLLGSPQPKADAGKSAIPVPVVVTVSQAARPTVQPPVQQVGTVIAPVQPPPVPVAPHAVLPAPAPMAASSANLGAEEVVEWIRACMDAFVEIVVDQEGSVSVRINKLEPETVNGEARVNRLFIGGLVELNRTKMDAKLTARAARALPEDLKDTLDDYADVRMVYGWLHANASVVDGTLEREAYLKACAGADVPITPIKAAAALEDGCLLCSRTVTREIFRSSEKLTFPQKRTGSKNLDVIPVTGLTETAQAVRAAREQPNEEAAEKKDSRRDRKRNRQLLINQVLLPGPEETQSPNQSGPI